jgi:hypothetical protein
MLPTWKSASTSTELSAAALRFGFIALVLAGIGFVGTWLELGSGKLLNPGWLLIAALLFAGFGFAFAMASLRAVRLRRMTTAAIALNLAELLLLAALLGLL